MKQDIFQHYECIHLALNNILQVLLGMIFWLVNQVWLCDEKEKEMVNIIIHDNGINS